MPADVVAWAQRVVLALDRMHAFLHASVYVRDGEGDLRLAALHGVGSAAADPTRPGSGWEAPDASVPGWVARNGTPSIVADVSRDRGSRPDASGSTRSELAVPVLVHGAVVAVISVQSERVAAFGIADLEAVRALAVEAAGWLPSSLPDPQRADE